MPEAREHAATEQNPGELITIDEHLPGAFTFRIKVAESGALFLITPRRDPAQPRFWCVVAVKCAPGGLVDPSEGGWLGEQNIRREDLAGTMTAIREDVNGWLAEPEQARLFTWVHSVQATPAGLDTVNKLQRGPTRAASTSRIPAQESA